VKKKLYTQVPDLWLDTLAKHKPAASTMLIALALLRAVRFNKTQPNVKVTNKLAASVGVSRWGKYTALQQLRSSGLIGIETDEARKSPVVKPRFIKVG
jgi:hypothetical protein